MDLSPSTPPPPARSRSRSKPPPNIQDSFLFASLKEDRILAFALVDGTAIAGRIKRFDRYAIIVESRGLETLLYKHGIVAITEPSG